MDKQLYFQARAVLEELGQISALPCGSVVVIGCSTSEIIGSSIGTNSSFETAGIVFKGLYDYALEKNWYLAFQCCEHLNRAIVVEKEAVPYAECVNVVPQPKAGGSMATQAYMHFKEPVVLEEIKADAGVDIGLTLIGMHLKKVAVPVRLENNRIGEALVVAARTRPKFIGGERAAYNQKLL